MFLKSLLNNKATLIILSTLILMSNIIAQDIESDPVIRQEEEFRFIVFWEDTNPKMTMSDLAAYCAPIFWFSSDEPELHNKSGKEIMIPAAFPFETQIDSPVVYYQVRKILVAEGAEEKAYKANLNDKNNSILDLSQIVGFDIDYNHYYKHETGLGMHDHDTEQAQFKIYVHKYSDDENVVHYQLYLLQVTAKAHALSWYDNIYKLDTENLNYELELPFHIMVEEGKHASVSDMNGDGYYTPGYDVNVRTNDAWGLRDVMRTGELFSAQFEAWMAKVRTPQFRVFPPLPDDSPHKQKYEVDGTYAPENAIYKLRPMPSYEKALPDKNLAHDMEGYFSPDWPELKPLSETQKFFDWWDTGNLIKSVGVALRVNNGLWGLSINFPLLIFKNVEAPLIGGWLVNRLYFQGPQLQDFGWNILYTPSASRFLDPYFALGFEIDKTNIPGTNETESRTDFVFETGIKLRGNVKYSPLKFLGFLSDFWGVRLGIKNRGFMDIDQLTYVFEIGAGVW